MSRCAERALQALLVCVAVLWTLLGPGDAQAQRAAELEAEYQRAVQAAQNGEVEQAAAQFGALLERLPEGHALTTLSIYGAARSYQQVETSAAACAAVDLFTRFIGQKDAEAEKRERASKALPDLIARCNSQPVNEGRAAESRGVGERVTRKIERLLDEAEAAEGKGAWETAVERYDDVLSLDPSHQEATRLKVLAQGRVKPMVVERPAPAATKDNLKVKEIRLSGRKTWMTEQGRDKFGVWAVILIAGERVKFRYFPPGTFVMGSTPDELGHDDDEEPQHSVQLSRGFWLAEAPTTQRLWTAVENHNPSRFKGDELPVENVSWDDVNRWISRANQRFLTEQGQLRLPTEAEWEYAARAGTTTASYSGPAEPRVLVNVAWFSENSGGKTQPVMNKMPSAWGLYDMLGNVSEWCADWRRDYSEECFKNGVNVGFNNNVDSYCARTRGTVTDPIGLRGSARVARGGSWNDDAHSIREADRRAYPPDNRYGSLGFRLAISE